MPETPCCDAHTEGRPPKCCDPDDCGPCCENCPTCPTLAAGRARAEVERLRAAIWAEVNGALAPHSVGLPWGDVHDRLASLLPEGYEPKPRVITEARLVSVSLVTDPPWPDSEPHIVRGED